MSKDDRHALERTQVELRKSEARVHSLESEIASLKDERLRLEAKLADARDEISAAIADAKRLAKTIDRHRESLPREEQLATPDLYGESPVLNSIARGLGRLLRRLVR